MARCSLDCNASVLVVLVIALSCEPLITGQDMQEYGGNCLMSICITNDAEVGCQQPVNVTTNVTGFSRLLRDLSLQCVTVYFTSGTHLLENSIIFAHNVTNIEIIGTVMPQTMIECGLLSDGLDFHARSGCILITNIVFEKCSKWRFVQEELSWISVALLFQNFNLTIENVTVQNSVCGIAAYECVEVVMRNCRFYNNTEGHVRINAHKGDWSSYGASVMIYQSLFYNGSSIEGGGLKIFRSVIGVRQNAIFVIKIIGCVFKQNIAYNGSHIYIVQDVSSLIRNVIENIRVLITDCIFTESAAHTSSVNSFGILVAQRNTPANVLNVTISKSIISNSRNGGIFISNANAVVIDQCKITNNRGLGISIIKTFAYYARADVSPVISQSEFCNNTKALDIGIAFFYFSR